MRELVCPLRRGHTGSRKGEHRSSRASACSQPSVRVAASQFAKAVPARSSRNKRMIRLRKTAMCSRWPVVLNPTCFVFAVRFWTRITRASRRFRTADQWAESSRCSSRNESIKLSSDSFESRRLGPFRALPTAHLTVFERVSREESRRQFDAIRQRSSTMACLLRRHAHGQLCRSGMRRSAQAVALPCLLLVASPVRGDRLRALFKDHSPAAGLLTYGRIRPARNPRQQLFSPPPAAASSRRFASKKLPARVLRCRCGPVGFGRSGRAHHGPPSQGNGPLRQQKGDFK